MYKRLWLFALLSTPVRAARPYYISESTLAEKVESQAELVASPSSFSLPPLSSKWGAAVLDAISAGGTAETNMVTAAIGDAAVATPVEGARVAADALRNAMIPGQNPFDVLEANASSAVVDLSRASRAALDMLVASLETSGDGRVIFASISAKGAISKWNDLVEEVVKEWQAAAQKRGGANATELEALAAFLNGKQTEGIHNVLASFSTE